MDNRHKFEVGLIASLFLIGALAETVPTGIPLLALAGVCAKIMAVKMMLEYGTFSKRRYFAVVYAVAGLLGVGVLFKILHYPGADQLLLVGAVLMTLIYSIHFATKPNKQPLDVLKFVCVVTFFVGKLATVFHYVQTPYLNLAAEGIFWLTFVSFVFAGTKSSRFVSPRE